MTHFFANNEGIVDLSRDLPTCGSYKDPDLMAVYWTMKPLPDSDARFWPLQVQKDLECSYEVFKGHLDLKSGAMTEEALSKETIHRKYVGKGVERIELEVSPSVLKFN